MKQDAEFLSKILSFDEQGKMSVKLDQNDYKQFFKMLKGNEYLSNTSSDVSSQQDSDQVKSEQSSQKYQYRFKKLGDDRVSISSCNLLETSNGLLKNETVQSYDGSVNDELEPSLTLEPRRGSQHNQLTLQNLSLLNKESSIQQPLLITDDEELLLLIESRMHWAIKRNVLKETMSEDLEWAQCIKNENDDVFGKI